MSDRNYGYKIRGIIAQDGTRGIILGVTDGEGGPTLIVHWEKTGASKDELGKKTWNFSYVSTNAVIELEGTARYLEFEW